MLPAFLPAFLPALLPAFLYHFFQDPAHSSHSFLAFLKETRPLRQFVKIHPRRFGTGEVVHQLPQGGVVPIGPVHIQDMGAVVKSFTGLQDTPLHLVQGAALPHHVMFGDEDDIDLRQLVKIGPLLQGDGIHHAGVVPGPPFPGAAVRPLHLHIDPAPLAVCGDDVQPDRAVQKVRHKNLGADIQHHQVRLVQDDAQHLLGADGIRLEAFGEKHVIHQPEPLDPLQVFLARVVLLFPNGQPHHHPSPAFILA